MTAPDFIILSLATWRLARLFSQETGPFALLETFRIRYPLGGLMVCMYCLSLWLAPIVWLLWRYAPIEIVDLIALSGGAMLLHRYTGGDHL